MNANVSAYPHKSFITSALWRVNCSVIEHQLSKQNNDTWWISSSDMLRNPLKEALLLLRRSRGGGRTPSNETESKEVPTGMGGNEKKQIGGEMKNCAGATTARLSRRDFRKSMRTCLKWEGGWSKHRASLPNVHQFFQKGWTFHIGGQIKAVRRRTGSPVLKERVLQQANHQAPRSAAHVCITSCHRELWTATVTFLNRTVHVRELF